MSTYSYGRPITEIYDTFSRHIKSLIHERSKANKEINEWSTNLMNEIGDHARQQVRLVEEAYRIHEKHLENIRDQCLEINRICLQKKDTEEITQLLEKCRNLKMNLVDLKRPMINKEFIEVTIIEPPKQLEQEEFHPVTTEGDKLQSRSIENKRTGSASDSDANFTSSANLTMTSSQPTTTHSNPGLNFGSSFQPAATPYNQDSNFGSSSKPTATHLDRTNQLPTAQSTYDYNQSTSITENKKPKPDVNNADNSIDKCPVCFMIFPSYMTSLSRTLHVDEHYKDE